MKFFVLILIYYGESESNELGQSDKVTNQAWAIDLARNEKTFSGTLALFSATGR